MSIKRLFGLVIWYSFSKYLPKSSFPVLGKFGKIVRRWTIKLVFKEVGKGVNIDRGAYFGNGNEIVIGNYSGIGRNCRVPSNTAIGNYVMMAEDVLIFNNNHKFDNLDIPMCKQGGAYKTKLVIEDDVWIGARVIILPSVNRIGTGVIIGAGAVVTKNIPDFAIIGGNPAKILKYRK